MSRVLITGMSGTGKSTALTELARRGHHTVDTDYSGYVLADGTWDEGRMRALLAAHPSIVVAGTVQNQGRFSNDFSATILLSAPIDVLIERVVTRTSNPYGRSAADQAEIRRYIAEVEPLLRASATIELDARLPICELADLIEGVMQPLHSQKRAKIQPWI